jgi:two-component system response regulator RegA
VTLHQPTVAITAPIIDDGWAPSRAVMTSPTQDGPNAPWSRVVLVVDDDPTFREQLAKSVRRRGHHVLTADGTARALGVANTVLLDAAIIDLHLGEESGLDVLRALLASTPRIRAVILTGQTSGEGAAEAKRCGAVALVSKPCDVDDLLAAVFGITDR